MKKLITICLFLLGSIASNSCTTFVLKNDTSLLFGRNLDWVSDNGVVVVNSRNVQKTSLVFPPDSPTSWTSKYGSVTFNQFGKEFPFGGINEKGLVIEIMVVDGSYPSFDNRRAINELQWVQYQLDNSKSIEDVIGSDKDIRISKIDKNIHFLICDSFGHTAVIEFDKKGMNVYKDTDLPFPVLENETYAASLKKKAANKSCRFKTASDMISVFSGNTNVNAIDYSFKILDKVALDGSWRIVYDIKNMEIHFKTASYKTIRKIEVNVYDFSCAENGKLYDLKSRDNEDVTGNFIPFSSELNMRKLDAAIKSNRIQLPKVILDRFYGYNDACTCLDASRDSGILSKHAHLLSIVEVIEKNRTLRAVSLENEEFMEHLDHGGELHGFYKDNQIVKVSVVVYFGYGLKHFDYYINQGKLIFMEETFDQYGYNVDLDVFDYSTTERNFHGQYVFENSKLIDSISTGHNRFENDEIDIAQTILGELVDYLDLISKKDTE